MSVIACFVTGTDTGVGKTLVATGLLKLLGDRGLETAGYKPVAAGCEPTADGLRSADALNLIDASTLELGYDEVNPVALEGIVAPHIAALHEDVSLDIGPLVAGYQRLASRADAVIVEGAGGWRVPLGGGEDMGDLAAVLDLPVVLVVGVRLGCLSHALLTAESIVHAGLEFAGTGLGAHAGAAGLVPHYGRGRRIDSHSQSCRARPTP